MFFDPSISFRPKVSVPAFVFVATSNLSNLSKLDVIIKFPDPFDSKLKSILVSSPDVLIFGPLLAAAFVIVISLIAEVVSENLINSSPFESAINPPFTNFGAVNVLLVNV